MRVKNDTCIKSYQLTNTMFLTNEEFGMLIRKLMIEDDEEGFRYDVDKDIKTEYLNCEKTWLDEFEEAKKNNPILKQAYMVLRGQTIKSRKAFEDLQKVFDKKDGRTKQTAEIINKNLNLNIEDQIEVIKVNDLISITSKEKEITLSKHLAKQIYIEVI